PPGSGWVAGRGGRVSSGKGGRFRETRLAKRSAPEAAMRVLALFLAFVLVLTSLPAMAAPAEGAAPAEAPATAVDVAPGPPSPASQPTLRDMLARTPQADF